MGLSLFGLRTKDSSSHEIAVLKPGRAARLSYHALTRGRRCRDKNWSAPRVAGVPPTWGDDATEPLVTEDEATIATDRFDPTLREGLRDFFRKALRRNVEERFGNAEDMVRELRRAFEPLDRGAIAEDSIETIARRLDRRSTIAELGYSVEARDVLDRMGVHTVQQLLAVDRIRFRYLRSAATRFDVKSVSVPSASLKLDPS